MRETGGGGQAGGVMDRDSGGRGAPAVITGCRSVSAAPFAHADLVLARRAVAVHCYFGVSALIDAHLRRSALLHAAALPL